LLTVIKNIQRKGKLRFYQTARTGRRRPPDFASLFDTGCHDFGQTFHFQNHRETTPQKPAASHFKNTKNLIVRNMLIFNMLHLPVLPKKYVVKPAAFSYVHCNCTAWCRGKEDLP